MHPNPFGPSQYMLRKQFFKMFGGSFRIYDPSGSLAFFASMKAFKLKEDIRVYADEAKTSELITIKARNIIDISAVYDVWDCKTREKLGALKRSGLKSMFKDEWFILDTQDQQIGIISEDRWILALLRRFATNLIPQSFDGQVNGTTVLKFSQHFNPFVQKLDLDYSMDTGGTLDRRLGIAAAVLLCSIEGRQGQ